MFPPFLVQNAGWKHILIFPWAHQEKQDWTLPCVGPQGTLYLTTEVSVHRPAYTSALAVHSRGILGFSGCLVTPSKGHVTIL